ncbi:MAG: PTS sugar transporter subunit IIA, partial [Phycisphaerae bacterium]|nr:PTS sugar transporter subunit IIA [Phycisphaerae bacterium]
DQTGPHIQALAKISRMMLDKEFKTKLENAKTSEEAVELINTQDK